ncbi:MAG: DUF3106 domain-containing protein [Candidatus Didemnitutus sp.]|nr:DUF3106 domain-containing protein [Candidatus Didemnitutus sp.]
MKTTLFLVLGLSLGLDLRAAEAPADVRELSTLEQFLALDDAQLAQMQQAIARVRAMSAAERAQLRAQIEEFRRLPAAEREQLRRGWGHESPEIRAGWRDYMQSLDDAGRAELRRVLEGLSPEERTKLRRERVEQFLRERAAKH